MKSIIISTQQTAHNEWLAFSSWYSIHRNAPTVKVGVIFPRGERTFQFNWLRKCEVPFKTTAADLEFDDPIVLPDTTMLIRADTSNTEIVPAGSEDAAAFVDVSKVGKFDLNEWIKNEKSHPFHRTAQLLGKDRTVNEQRVIALWRQMAGTFDFINRP